MSQDNLSGFHAEVEHDRAALRGPGLGVAFGKQGDRWTHAVRRPASGDDLATASFAGPGGDDPTRVANPVYQEVQLHGPADGPGLCLLLTGLSFHHHFSAAVTLGRDPDERGRVLLDFDVADRCRGAVESLAATYLVGLESGALVAADPGRILWEVGGAAPGRLELVAGPRSSLAMAEAGRTATRVQILAEIQPGTFTHRVRYGWRWTSAGGLTR